MQGIIIIIDIFLVKIIIKNQKIKSKKMCEEKIKIDIFKEIAQITKLHSNECLENAFVQISIMSSLKIEITKRVI